MVTLSDKPLRMLCGESGDELPMIASAASSTLTPRETKNVFRKDLTCIQYSPVLQNGGSVLAEATWISCGQVREWATMAQPQRSLATFWCRNAISGGPHGCWRVPTNV